MRPHHSLANSNKVNRTKRITMSLHKGSLLLLMVVPRCEAFVLSRGSLCPHIPLSAAAGDVVTIDCKLQPKGDFVPEPLFDGIVLLPGNNKKETLSFVLHGGNYVPGLHQLVAEMELGEERSNVELDAGWGDWNPDLSATLEYEKAGIDDPKVIQVGVSLAFANGMKCKVTERNENTFTVDANPPLAGASYVASVKLLTVKDGPTMEPYPADTSKSPYHVATFALGCFWGGELAYQRLPGVVGTSVGYTQGQTNNPSYEEVCSGNTGHTEAIAVVYDPKVVSYRALVELAMERLGENKFLLHQVGNDRGTQYRHGVYFHTDTQREVAEGVLKGFGEACVTECLPAREWHPAEEYHQQYLLKGGQSARKNHAETIRCYG